MEQQELREQLRAVLISIRDHSRDFAEMEDPDTMVCRIAEKAQAGLNHLLNNLPDTPVLTPENTVLVDLYAVLADIRDFQEEFEAMDAETMLFFLEEKARHGLGLLRGDSLED